MSDFLSHLGLDILEAEIVSEGDLEQYGVKGMKWGVRRSQAQLDRAAGRTQKRASRKKSRAKKAAKFKKSARKNLKTFSDVLKGVGLDLSIGAASVAAAAAAGGTIRGLLALEKYISKNVRNQSYRSAFNETKQWVQTDPSRILNELAYILPNADQVFDITGLKK